MKYQVNWVQDGKVYKVWFKTIIMSLRLKKQLSKLGYSVVVTDICRG